MKNLYLVMVSGYPSSGKSRLTTELARSDQWKRLSMDDIRTELFQIADVSKFTLEQRRKTKETLILRRDRYLLKGKNVVIDRGAVNNRSRRDTLKVSKATSGKLPTALRRFFISLRVERNEILRRAYKRGHLEIVGVGDFDRLWEEPRTFHESGVTFIEYDNNVEEDFQMILFDLKRLFGIES